MRPTDVTAQRLSVHPVAAAGLEPGTVLGYTLGMCRNIRMLFNFDPPATDEEVRAASLQFVRKISGCQKPARANQAAFQKAIEDVTAIARGLIDSMVTSAPPRRRELEAARARARAAQRFGRSA